MSDDCIIFDLDGTLADIRHRLHHIRSQQKPNWPAFFDACVNDSAHNYVVLLNELIAQASRWRYDSNEWSAITVIICSGRPETHRAETEKWLADHGIFYRELLMRAEGDYRADTIVKREMLDAIRGQGYNVLFAVDDRPSVVRMWRENDVPVLQVDDSSWKEPQIAVNPQLYEECRHCMGTGTISPAMDLLARPPREQAEYERQVAETELNCPICGGRGTCGKTLLTLMIGPSGAGKSTWLETCEMVTSEWPSTYPADLGIQPAHIISSDQFRADLCGDWRDQTRNQEVFAAVHAVASARLRNGLPTVIDATHLRRRDRRAATELAPNGTRVRYVVIDRPLSEKLINPRTPEHVVRKHDQMFKSQLKDILAGDEASNVEVVDLRQS